MKNFLLLFIILASFFSSYKTLCSTPDTLNHHITIDLKDFYSEEKIVNFYKMILNAALNGEITAYKNDSLISIMDQDEINHRIFYEEAIQIPDTNDPTGQNYWDTVILTPMSYKNIHLFTVTFKRYTDHNINNCKLIYTGFSLNYNMHLYGVDPKIYEKDFYNQPLFFVSKADLIKVLGEKETNELFENCYKAMFKSINYNKTANHNRIASFNLDMNEYLGEYTMNIMNKKMYNAITKGLPGKHKLIPAYKTDELKNTYSVDELNKRSFLIKTDTLASSTYLFNDTKLISPNIDSYYPEGYKFYSISFTWDYDSVKTIVTAGISGFGMYLPIEKNDHRCKLETFFWFNWKNAELIFTPNEISKIRDAFYEALINYEDYHIKRNYK